MSAPSIPSAPADLELIAQLKSKLQYVELRIRVLEERLRRMRIEKYGAGGEKLSQVQMQLFELEPVVCELIERGERASATASLDQEVGQASGPPGVACDSSSRRADSALRIRSAPMQTLWKRNSGDRLRGEFPTREAGLPVV